MTHEITTTYYKGYGSSKQRKKKEERNMKGNIRRASELLVSDPNFSQLLICFPISDRPNLRCLGALSSKHCNKHLYFTKCHLFLYFSCLNNTPLLNIQEAHDLLGMLAIQKGKVDYQWPFAYTSLS
jgi:hypothetical protein